MIIPHTVTDQAKVEYLNHLLDRCIDRANDLHLCAVVDSLRTAQAILKTEARARLNVYHDKSIASS